MTTKEKILVESTRLFNKEGFSAVSLFEIANTLGISRGNLAYHFKTKLELLKAITNEMWGKIEKQQMKSRLLPSFENLHNQIQLYYKFQKEYKIDLLKDEMSCIRILDGLETNIKSILEVCEFKIDIPFISFDSYNSPIHFIYY